MMLGAVLDLFFPRTCLACRGRGWPFCRSCLPQVAVLAPPGCERCGRPLEWSVERCADCPPPPVGWARAALLYDGPVRKALMALKFGGLRSCVDVLGGAMLQALERAPPPGEPFQGSGGAWTVAWVPLAPGRLRARGFDQAELLARRVARVGGWPARPLLRRRLETRPQARRGGADRRSALRGAFLPVARPPQRVLLVDDVLTTGATAAECAEALRRAGTREIGLLAAARSLRGTVPPRCYNPAGLRPGSVVARETSSR